MEPQNAERCPSVCRATEEPCSKPSGHDGCHGAEPSIPGTCGTVWVDHTDGSRLTIAEATR